MENQKRENLLNLALDATPEERQRSLALDVGYDSEARLWEVVVQYRGSLAVLEDLGISVTYLLTNYAILVLTEEQLLLVSSIPEVIYIEKPKNLYFAVNLGRQSSCINTVQQSPDGLFGEGVLIACIDSGIDYSHMDFRNEDGTTRLIALWDQTIPGNPPDGYHIGTLYTEEQINEALQYADPAEQRRILPSVDSSGHGTAVMGIAAGNGNESGGVYRGVAPRSRLLAVKLGSSVSGSFPRTTQLMQAVDFAVRESLRLSLPLVINLSFGNSYGSHSGDSLLETYLNSVAALGQISLCIGTGNEGNSAGHYSDRLSSYTPLDAELSVGTYTPTVNVQLWKYYVDEIQLSLIHPNNTVIGPISPALGPVRFQAGQTELLLYYGMPSPYSLAQEVYVDFLPARSAPYIDSGVWTLRLLPGRITEGEFHLWLPGGGVLGESTRFYRPVPDTTLTIPSSAARAISVGAYNPNLLSYADFSGRGFTRVLHAVKPDLAAPGTDIQSVKAGGGYGVFTGTSFATPFVSGAAALLMEWGIVWGNDPFLYGEKLKAQLIRGAARLPAEKEYPNPRLGYGVLCLSNSF